MRIIQKDDRRERDNSMRLGKNRMRERERDRNILNQVKNVF